MIASHPRALLSKPASWLAVLALAGCTSDPGTGPSPGPDPTDPRFQIPGPFGFLPELRLSLPISGSVHFLTGDVDGDGRLDLVFNAITAVTNDVAVARGQANGTFAAMTRIPHGQPVPTPDGWGRYAAQAGDITGDGRTDLVWYDTDRRWRVYTAVATAAGGFTFPDRTQHPENLTEDYRVRLADVDGDGARDIIWNRTVNGSNRTWIGHSSRDGRFEVDGTKPFDNLQGKGWAPYNLFIGDVDGDHRDDLIWNTPAGTNRVYIGRPGPLGSIAFLPAQDHPVKTDWFPYQLEIVDPNGDGMADLLWVKSTTTENKVYLAPATGGASLRFAAAQTLPSAEKQNPGPGPLRVELGDVDGDGRSDLIWIGHHGVVTTVGVTRGTAGDVLDADWPVQQHPDAAEWVRYANAAGDVNGDGKDDLIWLNTEGGTASIFVALAK